MGDTLQISGTQRLPGWCASKGQSSALNTTSIWGYGGGSGHWAVQIAKKTGQESMVQAFAGYSGYIYYI